MICVCSFTTVGLLVYLSCTADIVAGRLKEKSRSAKFTFKYRRALMQKKKLIKMENAILIFEKVPSLTLFYMFCWLHLANTGK